MSVSRSYDTIHIVGDDSAAHVKKFKMKYGVRLKLLRRTLRGRRVLAQYVRELNVPEIRTDSADKSKETIDLVASIVMACPNLEKLVGFYTTYDHNFDRLTHALSTRRKLKERVWVIGENEEITDRSHNQLPPGLMDPAQTEAFLQFHEMWTSLDTLFLHSQNMGILEHEVFVGVFRRLPSLQHLCISNFDIDDFNDATLQALPPLQSLRLQGLPGITDQGLSRFAGAATSQTLRRLSLINLEIKSILVLSKILAHLTSLDRFTFIQESSPSLLSDVPIIQPILASPTLSYIHWDILAPGPANPNFASSVLAGGFPSLRTIRSPTDHDGLLQSICRPRAQVVLASDKYNLAAQRSALARAQDPTGPGPDPKHVRTLFAARKRAQERLEEARNTVSFKVVVDEDGLISQVYDFSGFVGRIGSRITYSLRPDVAGSDVAVVEVEDLLGRGCAVKGMEREKEGNVKDGCTGMWNASHPAGKKWWWHTERVRWRGVELGRFF
ncbi:hypothetical protein MMC16_000118 [Acarospora aff. strigata]|nr:hypothetical protein [Acarospora aff. strigata]